MVSRHPNVIADEVALPAAVIRKFALDNNLAWMSAFARSHGLSLAPHGKTTMSPELIRLQMESGAWGMTAASPFHAALFAKWGIRRIMIANQIVGRQSLDALIALLREHPGAKLFCLVDSLAGVRALSQACVAAEIGRSLGVLVEIGDAGQRAGVRSTQQALEVARAVHAAKGIALSGIEIFEGVHTDPQASAAHLQFFADAMKVILGEELIETDEVIVSAGGSLFYDQAAVVMLSASADRPVRPVLRSGCYLTHDHGMYAAAQSGVLDRAMLCVPAGGLQPALEVWAHVQSRPEPRQVIVALGKRHVSSDAGLPTPLWHVRPGCDSKPQPLEQVTVERLFDQHACLAVPNDSPLSFGDLIGFGISHPCTTFDKWRHLLIVDEDYRVLDRVSTHFGIV
jgi:D-serine dehydratase